MKKSSPKNKNFIIRKFEDSFAIWFSNSKSFLLLEEPAYTVFDLYTTKNETKNIVEECNRKYGHLEEDIKAFVKEIIKFIDYYNNQQNATSVSKKSMVTKNINAETLQHHNNYLFGNKVIDIYYEDDNLLFFLHPIIAHLSTVNDLDSEHTIECFKTNYLYILKLDGIVIEAFEIKEIEYFKGAFSQLLYSLIYKRDFSNWMTTLHASGIYSKNKAILFSAAAGHGKSTIAALLKTKGYGYISDDFIAADTKGNVFPFPASISVKEGAVSVLSEFYPELNQSATEKAANGKIVKYLPVNNISEETNKGIPVKAFVFVRYSKSGEFVFEEINKKIALQILLKETWINPTKEYVSDFFTWIENARFYRLQYKQTSDALKAVQQIMNE